MKSVHTTARAAAVIATLLLPARLALADAATADLSTAKVATLATEWWEWTLSTPAGQNASIDATGAHCTAGAQHGSVWFLGFTFVGSARRSCTIPAGDSLFFPVSGIAEINTPGTCGQDAISLTKTELADAGKVYEAQAKDVSLTIDGVNVTAADVLLGSSNFFTAVLPANNVFQHFGITPCPKGSYAPAIGVGYYALVPALAAGKHTLAGHAKVGSAVWDVGYTLNVVKPAGE